MASPAPYPADTRARGWRFEVDMEKVKASDTWLKAKSGAVRGALLLLWAEAWQQTPCGTLPNDDELCALMIDMADATFAKHRAVLLRGWKLADDGRLYHDTITARVLAMLDKRASDAQRAAKRRGIKSESPADNAGITDASRVTHAGSPREFDTKHQAPSTKENTPLTPKGEPEGFTAFWAEYPNFRKGAKGKCLSVWAKTRCEGEAMGIIGHIQFLKTSSDWTRDGGQYIPAPLVYLNKRLWEGAETGSVQGGLQLAGAV